MTDADKHVSGLSLLIIEDDDGAAQLIKTNLKRAGLEAKCFRAKNGLEGIEFLENGHADREIPENHALVILLDIRMPKMDGIKVLERIKSSNRFKKLPVVMLTTSDRRKEVEACYELGCNFYLKKQVDYPKFVDSIKKLAHFISVCELPLWRDI